MKFSIALCDCSYLPCLMRAFLSARCSFTKESCTSFLWQRLGSRTGTSVLPVPPSQRRWRCYPPAPRSSWLQSPSELRWTNASMGVWGFIWVLWHCGLWSCALWALNVSPTDGIKLVPFQTPAAGGFSVALLERGGSVSCRLWSGGVKTGSLL